MEVMEFKLKTDTDGALIIPPQVLSEMGIHPGEEVFIAYTAEAGKNRWHEFLLTGDGFAADQPSELAVPDVLLAEAGIPQDADLQLVCLNGALLITQNTMLTEAELAALLDGLYAANEIAAQLPDDESALDCLQNALKRAERETENA